MLGIPRHVRRRNCAGILARITKRAYLVRHLAIPLTTGMPHRPTSIIATGNLRFSYSQTLSGGANACRRLPVAALASASLSEASVRLPFLSSLTAEGRCGMDSTESQITRVSAIAENRSHSTPRGPQSQNDAIARCPGLIQAPDGHGDELHRRVVN